MDDLEKNAEWTEQDSAEESLGYEACQETAEAAVDTTTPQFAEEARGPEEVIKSEEAVESEKTMTDLAAEPELTAAEAPGEEKGLKNGGSNFLAILIGLAAFVGILVFCWQMPGGGVRGQDTGVLYAKDDALYYYDLKNEPYLLEETISSGGAYHYYYTAWGAECAEEGNWIYYAANIDESGAFDLYRKDGQDTGAAAVLISGEVYDYMTSKDGEIAAYLSGEKDSLNLYLFVNGESRLVSEGLHLEEGAYALSGDGKHLAYTDAYSILCAVNTEDAGQPMKLTDAAAMYAIAEEADVLYFVAQNYDVYNIYSYAFDKEEPALVAENVSYMEVMPNGRDLLYCAVSTEEIPYSALITDDMLESDEALAETEGEEYEAKVKRDAIREAMSNGEGIAPVLQDCYIFTNGTAVLAAEDVISAVAVDNQKPFVTGYRAGTVKPIPLSALDGELQTAEYYYYMSLAYGEMNTFLADAAGNCEDLTGYGVQPDTIILSQDARYGAYLASDPVSGGYILMQMEVGQGGRGSGSADGCGELCLSGWRQHAELLL